MMLSEKEKYRYSRHLLLDKVGLSGQEKLKAARVLVIGAGGLGCPVLQYLAAAGVGTVGIVDFDNVDETNLQRQVLFTTNDIGSNKAEAACLRLEKLNPYIDFQVYPEKLTPKNALNIFNAYDIVVDGTDNFSTRYLVNDAAILSGKPLVYGAIYKFEGQVTVFNFNNGPSYRCLFPDPPESGSVPNCSEIGVLGVLPGLIGTQQANEVLKIILGIGSVLSGRLLVIDALQSTQFQLEIKRHEEQFNLVRELDFEHYNYDHFCGIGEEDPVKQISAQELKLLFRQDNIQVIDVREPHETPNLAELNAINIPLQSISDNMDKIARDKMVVIHCQHGVRSMKAIHFLKQQGFNNLVNLTGGIVTYE